MLIVLPIVVLFVALGILSWGGNFLLLVPMIILLVGGVVVIAIAVRDGRPVAGRPIRRLPTTHLARQIHLAMKPRRPRRRPGGDAGPKEPG